MNHSPQLDSFETALLTELRREVAEHPAAEPRPVVTRRPRRTLRLVAVAATGVAASVVAVLGLGGSGGSPAYAVEQNGAGDVVVTIHRLDDAAGLEQALKDEGIDADVSYDPAQSRDTAMLGSNGAAAPPSGSGSSEGGLSQQDREDAGAGSSGQGPNDDGVDPCGPIDPAPARLRHPGSDWVLSIPAGSPLQDRHVDIGTGPDGTLSVQYAGSRPGVQCGLMSMDAPAPGTR
jgi:hypothetical protein